MVFEVNVPAFVCLSNLPRSRLVRVYKADEARLGGHGQVAAAGRYMGRGCPPMNLAARLPKAGNVISVTQTDQHWLLAPGGENPSDREGGEGRC